MSIRQTIKTYPFNAALTFAGTVGFALLAYAAIVG